MLYLVQTTVPEDKWEIIGGNYLVLAESEDEIRSMKFGLSSCPETIHDITPIDEHLFTKASVFVINNHITE